MLIFKLKKQFYKSRPILQEIAELAKECPQRVEEGAAHFVSLGSSVQYVYYNILVDYFLNKRIGLIVDWGGQYGHVTILLQNEGYDAECYFLAPPPNFEIFQERFRFPFRYGSTMERVKLPYQDNSALAVVSSGVLEHVREYGTSESESLTEIFRVIKPGGYLFIWNLPRVGGFPEVMKRLIGRWYHPFKYTKNSITQLVKSAGFEIVFYDSHEFSPIGIRKLAEKIGIPPWLSFEIDFILSKTPPFSFFRQHITIICKKPNN